MAATAIPSPRGRIPAILANAAASMLDNLDVPNLVGTLAGDDTAFLAMRDVGTALDFCREIEAML